MEDAHLSTATKNERLAMIVDRCLQSTAAYQLFDMLSSISQLDQDDKQEYMDGQGLRGVLRGGDLRPGTADSKWCGKLL